MLSVFRQNMDFKINFLTFSGMSDTRNFHVNELTVSVFTKLTDFRDLCLQNNKRPLKCVNISVIILKKCKGIM